MTTNPGFSFGSAATPASSSGFASAQNATVNQTSGFSFGTGAATTAAQTSNVGFNLPSNVNKPANSTSQANLVTPLGIGTVTTQSLTQGLNFGTGSMTTQSSSQGLAFGTGSASIQNPSQGLNFGTGLVTTTSSQGLNFGASAPSTVASGGFSFTAPVSTSAPSSLPFGGSTTSIASTNQGGGSLLKLGAPVFPASTTTPSSAFAFNTPNSSGQSSIGGTSFLSTSAAPSTGLGGPAVSSTEKGLGGTATLSGKADQESTAAKNDGKVAKEAQLPAEIFTSIAEFEKHKDFEKKASEENVRQTATRFHKLGDDAKKLKQHILKLSNQHSQLHQSAINLKASVVQEAQHVEMARITHETPVNQQGTNKSPEAFFIALVRSFEERMTNARNKIEEVERCFSMKTIGSSASMGEADLLEILRKEHETIKMLAARIYTTHSNLMDICHKSKSASTPMPFFKPTLNQDKLSHSIESSVLRPCLGDVNSGLQNFQTSQEKAKAISLNAGPPIVPLTQTSSAYLGNGGSSMFNSSGFGTASKAPNLLSAPFGSQNTQSFGNSFNNSSFAVKPFGNSQTEKEEGKKRKL